MGNGWGGSFLVSELRGSLWTVAESFARSTVSIYVRAAEHALSAPAPANERLKASLCLPATLPLPPIEAYRPSSLSIQIH